MTVPDYPNLLMVYGPNAQGGHGGSLISAAEIEIHYLVAHAARRCWSREIGAVESRRERYEDYSRQVDEIHERMIWSHPGMNTYYRNSRGRVTVATPWRVVDYWEMTRAANLDEYVVEPARALTETG